MGMRLMVLKGILYLDIYDIFPTVISVAINRD